MNFLALSICRLRKFASVFEIVSNTALNKLLWSRTRHIRDLISLKGTVTKTSVFFDIQVIA